MIFDCTWPKDWPAESIPIKASFENLWPEDVRKRVLSKWEAYGFKSPEAAPGDRAKARAGRK